MSDAPLEKDPPRGPCYEYQNDHISAAEFFEQIDATPNSELREFVENMGERVGNRHEALDSRYDKALEDVKQELKDIIDSDKTIDSKT